MMPQGPQGFGYGDPNDIFQMMQRSMNGQASAADQNQLQQFMQTPQMQQMQQMQMQQNPEIQARMQRIQNLLNTTSYGQELQAQGLSLDNPMAMMQAMQN